MRGLKITILALCALAMGACSGCAGTPYKGIATAQVTLNKFARFVEVFDRGVRDYVKAEDARCTAANTTAGKLDAKGYGECIRPALQFSVAWTGEWKGKPTGKGVLPTIQDIQRSTRVSLDAAFDYVKMNEAACGKEQGSTAKTCAEKVAAWRQLLKPAVCALVPMVDRAVKLGAYKKTEDPTYIMIKGLATSLCK